MKGAFAAVAAAALAGGASANIHHRHAHDLFHNQRRGDDLCTTYTTTYYGEPTLCPPAPKPTTTTSKTSTTTSSTSTSTPPPAPTTTSTTTVEVPLPTDEPHTCPTPGTYTFPATTVIVDKTTTVCVPETTHLPTGTHTYGGVTTVVEEATTVVCPVATVTTSGDVTTSVIVETEYVCPTPGTYTIAPTTVTVTEDVTTTFPVPTIIIPGTYTAPEQIVTVTVPEFVYVCPYTSVGLPEPSPAPAPAPKPEPKPETKPKPDFGIDVDIDIGLGDDGLDLDIDIQLGSHGDHWAITYTPYESENGNCKSKEHVLADIQEIKDDGFESVRVYSTDCNTLEYVGDACRKVGLEMIVGVFVKDSGCSINTPEIKEQVDDLVAWGQWDMVKLVVVGNEAIMAGFCSADELADLVQVVRGAISGDYKGPITISETLNIWEQPEVNGALCDIVDVVGANIHPYFDPNCSPADAGDVVVRQLQSLRKICDGKDPINLEVGWPNGGKCNNLACPGPEEQAIAISSIREKVGGLCVFFSFENDMWKAPGDCDCEQRWGSKDCFKAW